MRLLLALLMLPLLSGCVHMVVPAIMSEAYSLHRMHKSRNVLRKWRISMTKSNPVRFGKPVDPKCEKCGRSKPADCPCDGKKSDT